MATALIGGMLARGRAPRRLPRRRAAAPSSASGSRRAFPASPCAPAATPRRSPAPTLVVLAVKPQQMRDAARALAPHLAAAAPPVVLSIAAGIRLRRPRALARRRVAARPRDAQHAGADRQGHQRRCTRRPASTPRAARSRAEVLEAGGELVWVDERERCSTRSPASRAAARRTCSTSSRRCEEAARELGFAPADARRLAYATFAGAVALAQGSDADRRRRCARR